MSHSEPEFVKQQLQALACLQALLQQDCLLGAVMATEIEFYLCGADALIRPEALLDEISAELKKSGIAVACIERERGVEQFEISLKPSADVVRIARDTIALKRIVKDVCAAHDVGAEFSARPFEGQPGSGLHIHIHLEDAKGRNQFFRSEDDYYSDPMLHAIGGLLALMPPCMPIFAPQEASYTRFGSGGNVPATVSWGPNNRTVAIRLPTKPLGNKHIEHRVSGSDADPAMAMAAILSGIHYGLKKGMNPGAPIYGDASLPMYGCAKIPADFESAMRLMRSSKLLPVYFGEQLFVHYTKSAYHSEVL